MASKSKRERKRANKQAGRASQLEAARLDRKRKLAIAVFILAVGMVSLSVLVSAFDLGGR